MLATAESLVCFHVIKSCTYWNLSVNDIRCIFVARLAYQLQLHTYLNDYQIWLQSSLDDMPSAVNRCLRQR